ncbi:MAG: DUF4390 domain-containing protein [Candidatus Eisenbacteria bacterium]
MRVAPFAAAILLLLTALPGAAAPGGTIWFNNIRVAEGWIEVDLEIPGGLPLSVVETLERGVPATLVYEIEIWRVRSRWFDRLEATQYLTVQIEHDPWETFYRARSSDGTGRAFPSLEVMEASVLRPERVRIAPLRRLDRKERHYIAVRAGVKPLELEQVRAIEDWLEGKIPGEENPEKRDDGIFRIPERLFGFLASIAGFGEETLSARSVNFRPEGLE